MLWQLFAKDSTVKRTDLTLFVSHMRGQLQPPGWFIKLMLAHQVLP